MARRSKDGSIIINVGSDAQRHLDRVAKREQIASERAAKREAKKAATRQRQALRQAGKRAAQMARAIQRQRDTDARRKAAREARKNWKPDPNRKKRSVHPKGKFATEKYNSYARRRERAQKLKATRLNSTTFNCNGYTVKVKAGTVTAVSCTCPDFTQMEGERDWKGSNAGPFNPCKHMMAVKSGKWLITVSAMFWNGFGCANNALVTGTAIVPIPNEPYSAIYNLQAGVTTCNQEVYGIGIRDNDGNIIAMSTACFNNASFGVCGAIGQPEVTITIADISNS